MGDEVMKMMADMSPEELAQQMQEAMDQMKNMFSDPEMMNQAAEGMRAAQELYKNPDAMNDMMGELLKELSDEDIESVRQMFIGGDGDPMMKELLGSINTAELEDVLQDPVKWRKTVKEGLGILGNEGGAGAGQQNCR